MYCLSRLHVNMLRLFKKLLIKKQMSMQKVKFENHDGIVLMLCMMLNLRFFFFFFHRS
jgi:hypothetical protein